MPRCIWNSSTSRGSRREQGTGNWVTQRPGRDAPAFAFGAGVRYWHWYGAAMVRREGYAASGNAGAPVLPQTTMEKTTIWLRRWFDPRMGADKSLICRWIFLRALALIYFSAFYSPLFQIKGLIGPQGIEPAAHFMQAVAQYYGATRYWHAPSLFWIASSSPALMAVMWVGIAASILALLNLWPRLSLFVCWICFLSFVSAAGDFSSYQSDGMLLEAGFISLFFAPPGLRPGLGATHPPIRLSLWLLQWEWFRIYFESGMVKWLSGDVQWRHLTAMDSTTRTAL